MLPTVYYAKQRNVARRTVGHFQPLTVVISNSNHKSTSSTWKYGANCHSLPEQPRPPVLAPAWQDERQPLRAHGPCSRGTTIHIQHVARGQVKAYHTPAVEGQITIRPRVICENKKHLGEQPSTPLPTPSVVVGCKCIDARGVTEMGRLPRLTCASPVTSHLAPSIDCPLIEFRLSDVARGVSFRWMSLNVAPRTSVLRVVGSIWYLYRRAISLPSSTYMLAEEGPRPTVLLGNLTSATSSLLVLTHMCAMFSQTVVLLMSRTAA